MKKGRIIILTCMMCLVLAVAALPFAAACTTQGPNENEPIRIGGLSPMTGASAETGPKSKSGMELRFEEANWEVAGRPVEFIFADEGGGDPAFAIDAAKKMVEMDKVDMIIGPLNGPMVMAVGPYLAGVKIVNLALMPTAGPIEALKKAYGGWTFSTRGKGAQLTRPFGEYAYKELGYRTVTTVAQDHPGGKEFIGVVGSDSPGGYIDGFQSAGGTVIQQQWVPYGTPDIVPYLSALKDADAVVVWLIPVDIRRFLKQYDELGLFNKMPVIIPRAGVIDEPGLGQLGDSVIGIVGEQDYLSRLDTSINKKFVAAVEAKYGERPDIYYAYAYGAASLALAGLKATGGDTTPEKLRQAMLKVKLETPAGRVSFTPSGFGIIDTYIAVVKKVDGNYIWEPIKELPETRPVGE